MKTFRFYGASDDLFEVEGAACEETGCFNTAAKYRLEGESGRLEVIGVYGLGSGATWLVGPTLCEEDEELPPWPMRYERADNGYSLVLVVETPDDVKCLVESTEEGTVWRQV